MYQNVPNPDILGDIIEHVQYNEPGSKNRPGGRHQLNLDNKIAM